MDVPNISWDILIQKNYLWFIWNSNLIGLPVFVFVNLTMLLLTSLPPLFPWSVVSFHCSNLLLGFGHLHCLWQDCQSYVFCPAPPLWLSSRGTPVSEDEQGEEMGGRTLALGGPSQSQIPTWHLFFLVSLPHVWWHKVPVTILSCTAWVNALPRVLTGFTMRCNFRTLC